MSEARGLATGTGTQLLRCLSELSCETLPTGVRCESVRCLLDNIACGISGARVEVDTKEAPSSRLQRDAHGMAADPLRPWRNG